MSVGYQGWLKKETRVPIFCAVIVRGLFQEEEVEFPLTLLNEHIDLSGPDPSSGPQTAYIASLLRCLKASQTQ